MNVLENSTLILCPWPQPVFLCKEAMFFLSTVRGTTSFAFPWPSLVFSTKEILTENSQKNQCPKCFGWTFVSCMYVCGKRIVLVEGLRHRGGQAADLGVLSIPRGCWCWRWLSGLIQVSEYPTKYAVVIRCDSCYCSQSKQCAPKKPKMVLWVLH